MSRCKLPSCYLIVLFITIVSPGGAHAINITTQYIWPPGIAPVGQPTNPNSVISANDPTAPFALPPVGLSQLMNYAEAYYEEVFEDLHSLQVNFWYENLNGFIGDHDLVSQGPSCANLTGPTASCRELIANVQFDASTNWFIDFSPGFNEEFDMQQTLWRDISVSQRNDWYVYGPNIPDTFEVGTPGRQ